MPGGATEVQPLLLAAVALDSSEAEEDALGLGLSKDSLLLEASSIRTSFRLKLIRPGFDICS